MRMAARPVKLAQVKRSKYRAVRTVVDGVRFASKAESRRYAHLKLLERTGAITELGLQPVFPLIVNGVKVATYSADFRYQRPDGEIVIEDVKGQPTPVYRLKKRIVEALYGFRVQEIR